MNLKVLKMTYHQIIFGINIFNLKSQNYELFYWSFFIFYWPKSLVLLDSCQPSVWANQPRKTRSLHWYTLCIIASTSWRIVKLNTWFTFTMDQMLAFALKQNRHINMLFTLQSIDFKSPGLLAAHVTMETYVFMDSRLLSVAKLCLHWRETSAMLF